MLGVDGGPKHPVRMDKRSRRRRVWESSELNFIHPPWCLVIYRNAIFFKFIPETVILAESEPLSVDSEPHSGDIWPKYT